MDADRRAILENVENVVSALEQAVGRRDLAERWGITRQRLAQLTALQDFPQPVGKIDGRPVWLLAECEAWRAARPRAGRPKRGQSS